MKTSKRYLTACFFLLIIGASSTAMAQRVRYPQLAMRNRETPVHFDFMVLPGDNDSTLTFASVFSLSYSYLPFKKMHSSSPDHNFYSTTSLSMEVFKSDKSRLKKDRKGDRDDVSLEGLQSAGRAFWTDTAYAKSYEQSQSSKQFLSGHLKVALKPGIYSYVLEMKRGEDTDGRLSRVQTTMIEPYSKMRIGNVIFGEKLNSSVEMPRLTISEMGDNVEYGKDFYAFAYIPRYESGASYTLNVNSINIADRDTTKQGQVYSQKLSSADIKTGILPKLVSNKDKALMLNLTSSNHGYAYALVKIPNSNFPNSIYRLTISKDGNNHPVATTTFHSVWLDMPTSLLNLDIAIDMLHYIADKGTIKKIDSGSQAEREKKFREFWKQKDPTPKTEYNELMAEYYRRIDYSFENFTTENTLGYESDQGEVYIKFGPPQNIERRFPTNGPTTEVWTYPNRQFVFKATTGFGDFQLVSDKSE